MVRIPCWIFLTMLLASGTSKALVLGQELHPPLPPDHLPPVLDLSHIPLGLSSHRNIPAENPLTAEKVALGRQLFFDPILSANRQVSCASCHLPELHFSSPNPLAIGIQGQLGKRHAPTLVNRTYGTSFFWDGRAKTLEDQALQPIESSLELGFKVEGVLTRLRQDQQYARLFQAAFPDGTTRTNLARALASFQRVLLSGDSPVDRFLAGDFKALTDSQRQGMWLFDSRAGCWKCHSGPNFTDERFHNTGISWRKSPPDRGLFNVTKQETDQGKFKTPSLRNIAETRPYMHDGSISSLWPVIEFYNQGGIGNPYLDPAIKPLQLTTDEIVHLIEFLKALTSNSDYQAAPGATGAQPRTNP